MWTIIFYLQYISKLTQHNALHMISYMVVTEEWILNNWKKYDSV